jgi:hypothetical protein
MNVLIVFVYNRYFRDASTSSTYCYHNSVYFFQLQSSCLFIRTLFRTAIVHYLLAMLCWFGLKAVSLLRVPPRAGLILRIVAFAMSSRLFRVQSVQAIPLLTTLVVMLRSRIDITEKEIITHFEPSAISVYLH